MSNNKIPCKECIVFALCYNRSRLHCQELYDFVCISNPQGFVAHDEKAAKQVFKLYKKSVISTLFDNHTVWIGK